jgi:hypothetical protein
MADVHALCIQCPRNVNFSLPCFIHRFSSAAGSERGSKSRRRTGARPQAPWGEDLSRIGKSAHSATVAHLRAVTE